MVEEGIIEPVDYPTDWVNNLQLVEKSSGSLRICLDPKASKDGLGCVLAQNGHPVVFAPRTLTHSKQKLAQIEKELLAIVFACQRFHFFLYGHDFIVE